VSLQRDPAERVRQAQLEDADLRVEADPGVQQEIDGEGGRVVAELAGGVQRPQPGADGTIS